MNQDLLQKIESAVLAVPENMREAKLKEELAKLSPKVLKQLQNQECPFCLMAEGKIQTQTIKETDLFKAVLEINPANPGHVLLFPKKHIGTSIDLTETQTKEIFNIANNISKALLKIYPATNIYLSNGKEAGQRFDHFVIHIIPRQEKDKVSFMWQPQKADPKQLEDLKQKIIQNLPKEQLVIVPTIKKEEPVNEDDFEKRLVSPRKRIP